MFPAPRELKPFSVTGSGFDDAWNTMPDPATARDPVVQLRVQLHEIILRTRPTGQQDQLGAAQESRVHEVNSLQEWMRQAALFREDLECIPVLAVATYQEDEEQEELDFLLISTANGRVAVLDLKLINDSEGGGLPEGLRIPRDVREWIESPRVMILSVGKLTHLKNRPFMGNIAGHVDATEVYRRLVKHRVIGPVSSALQVDPGDVDCLLAWSHGRHRNLSDLPDPWRPCLGDEYRYVLWPRNRSLHAERGSLTTYGRFFAFFTGLCPHIFISHVLLLGMLDEKADYFEESDATIRLVYPRFIAKWGQLRVVKPAGHQDNNDPAEGSYKQRDFWQEVAPWPTIPADDTHDTRGDIRGQSVTPAEDTPTRGETVKPCYASDRGNFPDSAEAGLLVALTRDAHARAAGCVQAWSRLRNAVNDFDRAIGATGEDTSGQSPRHVDGGWGVATAEPVPQRHPPNAASGLRQEPDGSDEIHTR